MAATTFNVDDKMDATLESLKKHYGAASKAEIFRKAIGLLKVAQDHEQADGSIVIKGEGPRKPDVKVVLR
jgi:hypothetical protein